MEICTQFDGQPCACFDRKGTCEHVSDKVDHNGDPLEEDAVEDDPL
jgi:hypothetical protein